MGEEHRPPVIHPLPLTTPGKKMQDLPIPSQQIKKLEQEAHAAQVRAILLANAKTRRGY